MAAQRSRPGGVARLLYIAHNTLLQRIAALRPTTETQLGAIKGMGKRKMAQYGAAILEIVKQAQS